MKTADYIVWQNAFLFNLDVLILLLIGKYLLRSRRTGEWRTWPSDMGVALFTYFLGMCLVRGMLLAWRHGYVPTDNWKSDAPLFIVGTIIAVVGAACVTRLMADMILGRWILAWVWCILGMAALAFWMTW